MESEKQIAQMVNFILNEARDKGEEIEAKTLQEFNIESMKYLTEQKEKIRRELTKKQKAQETQRAIARSTAINKARLQKIEARQKVLVELNELCRAELSAQVKKPQVYQQLLVDLIVQGSLKLMEETVYVRCRKIDEPDVKSALRPAAEKFAQVIKSECNGANKKVQLALDPQATLPDNCLGGVVLLCGEGNSIKVDNTLDTRLALEMQNDLPALRKRLFQK